MKWLSLILVLMFFLAPDTRAGDYSCLNNCIQSGGTIHSCNRSCRAIANRIEAKKEKKREDTSERVSKVNKKCYYDCVGKGGEVNSCAGSCTHVYDSTGLDTRRGQRPIAEDEQNCYMGCLGEDKITLGCFSACGKRIDSLAKSKFKTMDFDCFKPCRDDGYAFETCRSLCNK